MTFTADEILKDLIEMLNDTIYGIEHRIHDRSLENGLTRKGELQAYKHILKWINDVYT